MNRQNTKTTHDFYYKKDRLTQLRGFCHTVQNGCNMTKAAKKLSLEPTSIVKQIKALERDLNLELFDRSSRKKIKLNAVGQKFYDEAVGQLQGMEGLFERFLKINDFDYENSLKIASFDGALEKMTPFISKFQKNNPKVSISILNLAKYEAFEELKNNNIDLVFYPSDVDEECPSELERTKISDYTCYWTMYPKHPLSEKDDNSITREEIASYPFIVLSDLVYIKSYQCFINEFKLKYPLSIKNGTLELLKGLIRNEMGLSLINEIYLTEKDKTQFVLKNTINCFPKMYYYSFALKNQKRKDIAEKFYKIVKNNEDKIFH